MKITDVQFTPDGWSDYMEWFKSGDKKSFRKINDLIDDIKKNGLLEGIGKPERLKYREDEYSRQINKGDRLVYTQAGCNLVIMSCKGHYDDT